MQYSQLVILGEKNTLADIIFGTVQSTAVRSRENVTRLRNNLFLCVYQLHFLEYLQFSFIKYKNYITGGLFRIYSTANCKITLIQINFQGIYDTNRKQSKGRSIYATATLSKIIIYIEIIRRLLWQRYAFIYCFES